MMTARQFVGPAGASFHWEEPLPSWLEKRLESGEIREDKPEPPKPASKKKAEKE